VLRPDRQQIEDGILDRAAALFARHGFAQTSVQAVADAVGYSKAGLLHHYPSKEALRAAVLAQAGGLGRAIVGAVDGLPSGPERDRRALEALVDVALARPGMASFLLGLATAPRGDDAGTELDEIGGSVFEAFAVDPDRADPERRIRVAGAAVAVAFLAVMAHDAGQPAAWRAHVLATSFDALGHGRGAAHSRSDQESHQESHQEEA
jgi:AcrR family transcriptional regulator